jgi:four helix bundle protein
MTTAELRERMLKFGAGVIAFEERLPPTYSTKHIGRQLIRSATSIGANYDEAQAAESKADFTHKLQIALKECRESHYWLTLLFVRQADNAPIPTDLLRECHQLRAILSKAVVTAKSRP